MLGQISGEWQREAVVGEARGQHLRCSSPVLAYNDHIVWNHPGRKSFPVSQIVFTVISWLWFFCFCWFAVTFLNFSSFASFIGFFLFMFDHSLPFTFESKVRGKKTFFLCTLGQNSQFQRAYISSLWMLCWLKLFAHQPIAFSPSVNKILTWKLLTCPYICERNSVWSITCRIHVDNSCPQSRSESVGKKALDHEMWQILFMLSINL